MSAPLPRDKPLLLTERLELWLPQPDDLEPMFAIVSQPETQRYLGRPPVMDDHFMRFARNAGSWFLYGYGLFMVRLRGGDGALIGNCGIFHGWRELGEDFDNHPEGAWIIGADHVGKGYAEEAMRAVFEWFDAEHAGKRVVCLIDPDNAPSIKLAGKLGFGETRRAVMPDGAKVVLFERVS